MIESLRPVAAVGVCLLAAGLILLFGNRLHRNLREGMTIAAAVCAAGLVSVPFCRTKSISPFLSE